MSGKALVATNAINAFDAYEPHRRQLTGLAWFCIPANVRADVIRVFPGMPDIVKRESLTTLREKLIRIGAKVVHHARSLVFQLAEVAVPRTLFRLILGRIRRLQLPAAVSA